MLHLKLVAFAHAAEQLGWREMLVEAAPAETPRDIFDRIAPGHDWQSLRVAVDCEYHSWDEAVGPLAQEVALIPPVSGG